MDDKKLVCSDDLLLHVLLLCNFGTSECFTISGNCIMLCKSWLIDFSRSNRTFRRAPVSHSVTHLLKHSEKFIINYNQCCQALGPVPGPGPRMTQEDTEITPLNPKWNPWPQDDPRMTLGWIQNYPRMTWDDSSMSQGWPMIPWMKLHSMDGELNLWCNISLLLLVIEECLNLSTCCTFWNFGISPCFM